MSDLYCLDTSRVYWPAYNPANDTAEALMIPSLAIRLLAGAEQARALAKSYRNFRVGAAALAVYKNGQTISHRIVHGANAKPVEGSDIINVHAEHILMLNAEAYKEEGDEVTIPAIAVIGDLQPDQQSNEQTKTLHPCGVCRQAFEEHGSPISHDTICFTANPEHTTFEWFTIGALMKKHTRGDDSGIKFAKFTKRPLALSLQITTNGTVDTSQYDTPAYLRSNQEVASNLIAPMIEFMLAIKSAAQTSQ